MIIRASLCTLFLLSGPAFAATEKGVLYDCDITQKRDRLFWIADKIAIVVKDDGEVVVFDEVILHYHRSPMSARVTRDNDKKLAIRWTLKDLVNTSNQHTSAFEYSAMLDKKDNSIAVYATPDGYPNRFSGKGTCVSRTE